MYLDKMGKRGYSVTILVFFTEKIVLVLKKLPLAKKDVDSQIPRQTNPEYLAWVKW